jgi:hypothetical protein
MTIRRQFGEEPLVILNGVPDGTAGEWYVGPKSVSHLGDKEASSMRGAGRDLFSEHTCPEGAA